MVEHSVPVSCGLFQFDYLLFAFLTVLFSFEVCHSFQNNLPQPYFRRWICKLDYGLTLNNSNCCRTDQDSDKMSAPAGFTNAQNDEPCFGINEYAKNVLQLSDG